MAAEICGKKYCHRPTWMGRRLYKHYTMMSRRHMRARRARARDARRAVMKRTGFVVPRGRPKGSETERRTTNVHS